MNFFQHQRHHPMAWVTITWTLLLKFFRISIWLEKRPEYKKCNQPQFFLWIKKKWKKMWSSNDSLWRHKGGENLISFKKFIYYFQCVSVSNKSCWNLSVSKTSSIFFNIELNFNIFRPQRHHAMAWVTITHSPA